MKQETRNESKLNKTKLKQNETKRKKKNET